MQQREERERGEGNVDIYYLVTNITCTFFVIKSNTIVLSLRYIMHQFVFIICKCVKAFLFFYNGCQRRREVFFLTLEDLSLSLRCQCWNKT